MILAVIDAVIVLHCDCFRPMMFISPYYLPLFVTALLYATQVADYLKELHIEPEYYSFRWLTTLLSRCAPLLIDGRHSIDRCHGSFFKL